MDDFEWVLNELKDLKNELKCQMCNTECNELCKIKVCGHYSCRTCLKKGKLNCIKCKSFFTEKDLTWNNVFMETKDILTNLVSLLTHATGKDEIHKEKDNENIFKYNDKNYRVCFIEEFKVNSKGESALHVACRRKKLKEVNSLIEKQVDLNAQDFAGWVPLHECVESGSEVIVELLIKNGVLVDVPGEEYETPLHRAVLRENLDIIQLLLKNGADKDVIDYKGKKPFDLTKNSEILDKYSHEYEQNNRIINLYVCKKFLPFCYHIDGFYKEKLIENKIKIEQNYNSKKITHFIIRKCHKVSINILKAMLDGCMIVPQEWIDEYLKGNYFINIPTYTFIDNNQLNFGIRKAMINKLLKLPKLFDGINFYITKHLERVPIDELKVSKESLIEIIKAGGGKVLQRAPTLSTCTEKICFPFHAREYNAKCCNYIIYEELNPPDLMYSMPELKHKSSRWLLTCIINFSIFD